MRYSVKGLKEVRWLRRRKRGTKGVQGAPILEGTSKKEEEIGDLLFEGIHIGNDVMWLLSLGFSFRCLDI